MDSRREHTTDYFPFLSLTRCRTMRLSLQSLQRLLQLRLCPDWNLAQTQNPKDIHMLP
jgi:hypothetical protein